MRLRTALKRQACHSISVAVILGLSSQSARSDNFIATIEAPGVQQTQSVFFSVGMETFDTKTTAATFTSNFSTAVGSFPLVSGISGTVSFSQINTQTSGDFNPPFLYGGAGGTGAYPKDNGIISLNTAVNYFGLWVSAMNGGNTIKIYRESGGALLYTFTLSQMTSIVGSSSPTNLYYGNPNWQAISGLGYATYTSQYQAAGGEPYAFVNFYDTNGTFKYITIEGGGFESDNWTVGNYSAISGTNPAAPDIVSSGNGSVNTGSGIGANVNPKFDGGTLSASSSSTFSNNFSITANNGTLDANNFSPIYSGVFSNATSGVAGSLTIAGTAGTSITLSGINTYTGSTTINSGATLALSGTGSIATSSGLSNSGTFDISGTTSGASLVNMTGAGNTVLGAQTLTLTNGSGTYSGVISGAGGGVTISGGSKEFTGTNTYTGATSIGSGATLTLSGSGSISASSGVCNNGTLDISGTTSGASVAELTCTGNTVLGSKTLTLTGPANTTYGGVASGTGGITFSGGSKTLEGVNTYTGATTVVSGATLSLTTGSIAASSGLFNSGTFDISGTTNGTSLVSLTGSGNTVLGAQTLTLTNGSGTYSGNITGTGGLRLTAGSMTLSGTNTYSGTTGVDAGANLTLSSASALGSGLLDLVGTPTVTATLSTTATMSLSNRIQVTDDPTFNVAPTTTLTLTGDIFGAGDIVVTGGGTLVTTAVNTYTRDTTINSGSTFALSGAGSIAMSGIETGASGVFNNGVFNISAAANTIVLGNNLTQSSTGSLVMNWNQTITAAGAINLSGSLSLLNAGGGSYTPGRYTLISSSGGRTGTFSTFNTSALSGAYLYSLFYDVNDVFLDLVANGPSQPDTQQSLAHTASVLKNIFTMQHAVLANSFSYDCTLFQKNNVCASLGGRMTSVSHSGGLNDNSASFIGAYRPAPNYRFGIYAEHSLATNKVGSVVDLDPASGIPLVGLFGVWHERLDGTGTEIKVSASYGQKKATVMRPTFGGSEPGSGSSQMISQGAQVTVKHGFGLGQNLIVSPYVGFRYSNFKLNGYTETASAAVTTPLTFGALSVNAVTSLVGVFASYQLDPKVVIFTRGDLEADVNASKGTYSATGVTGLTDISFNANPVKTRASGTIGAQYYLQSRERVNLTATYREEPFQGKPTTSVRVSYDIGF